MNSSALSFIPCICGDAKANDSHISSPAAAAAAVEPLDVRLVPLFPSCFVTFLAAGWRHSFVRVDSGSLKS